MTTDSPVSSVKRQRSLPTQRQGIAHATAMRFAFAIATRGYRWRTLEPAVCCNMFDGRGFRWLF